VIHTGDCIEVMRGMPADSVDAVVTDPPYGLEFMGRSWDRLGDVGTTSHAGPALVAGGERGQYGKVSYSGSANKKCRRCNKWAWDHAGRKCECEVPDFPNVEGHQARLMQEWHYAWAVEALRVTKPGGYLLAFGGTRTHHRLVCGLEDAGWIIRDELDWIYASGFPKGKANLKPAHEPIVLARKPGPLRPLGIDECRIGYVSEADTPTQEEWNRAGSSGQPGANGYAGQFSKGMKDAYAEGKIPVPSGRWPSNVLLSDPELFDQPNPYVVGSGATAGDFTQGRYHLPDRSAPDAMFAGGRLDAGNTYTDTGGYSRFFIIPKADRADREPVLRGQVEAVRSGGMQATLDGSMLTGSGNERTTTRENAHPTVKPVDLMRHLVRLVTPSGGTVLDPFLGSGSTALACELEGFPWIGIEKEPEYVAIAEARLNGTQRGLGLDVGAPTPERSASTSHWPARRTPHKSEGWGFSSGQEGLKERWDKPDEEPAA
jgi:DNA modification methylase